MQQCHIKIYNNTSNNNIHFTISEHVKYVKAHYPWIIYNCDYILKIHMIVETWIMLNKEQSANIRSLHNGLTEWNKKGGCININSRRGQAKIYYLLWFLSLTAVGRNDLLYLSLRVLKIIITRSNHSESAILIATYYRMNPELW